MKDVNKTTGLPYLKLDKLNVISSGIIEDRIESAKSLFESGRSSLDKYSFIEADGNSLSSKKLLSQIEPLNIKNEQISDGDNYPSKRKNELEQLFEENYKLVRKNEILESKLLEAQKKVEFAYRLMKDKEELIHEVESYRDMQKTDINLKKRLTGLVNENQYLKTQLELNNKHIIRLEAENDKQKGVIQMLKSREKRISIKEDKLSTIVAENATLQNKLDSLELELLRKSGREHNTQTNLDSIIEAICEQNPHLEIEKENKTITFKQNDEVIATFKEESETDEILDTVPMDEMSIEEEKDQFFRINTEEQNFQQHVSILEDSTIRSFYGFEELNRETFAFAFLSEKVNNDYASVKSKAFLKEYYKKEYFKTKLAIIQERSLEYTDDKFSCKKECDGCELF